MSAINDGGPAFPAKHFDLAPNEQGMSLRDWFAGQAMMGMIAAGLSEKVDVNIAYKVADAMLAARSRPVESGEKAE